MAAGRVSAHASWRRSALPRPDCSRCRYSRERSRPGCSMLASSVGLVFVLYAAGALRLWRQAGHGRGVAVAEAVAFTTGCAALALALSPPLDEWSERSLAAHMVQHELMMVVAAPLVAVGAPLVGILWAI